MKNNTENIVVIGDAIIDKYKYWRVTRLNPEWPNPLLTIESSDEKLGWAANVAANVASLNWDTHLISLHGSDVNSKTLKTLCIKKGIEIHWIITEHDTICKTRFIETTYNQQLLRADKETIAKLTEDQNNKILEKLNTISPKRLVISDYNKWIISKELVDKLKDKYSDRMLVDTKPGNYELFKWVYIIKPNFKEFSAMVWEKNLEDTNKNIEKYWKIFSKKMWSNIVITRWSKWASLITKDGKVFHLPTEAKKVYDVTWAWDTFLAWLVVWLNKWMSIKDAVILWNKASWVVVGRVGTAIIEEKDLLDN